MIHNQQKNPLSTKTLKFTKNLVSKINLFTKTSKNKGLTDKHLIFSLNKTKIPSLGQLKYIKQFLNKKEKNIIRSAFLIIITSLVFLAANIYKNNIALAPDYGGNYTEGLTGSPKLINPLYASINTVDSDLSSLIYAGLLKKNKDNQIIPDLAETFEVSGDGLAYTFYLKQNVKWHNGLPFNADDVAFTFNAVNDSRYSSPLARSFSGIKVEKIDEFTVRFVLAESYSAFIELLTTGILPSQIWQQIPPEAAPLADLNIKPIGTGPYMFNSLTKDRTGNIRSYELKANENYSEKKPYIKILTFKFNPNFQESINALNEGRVEGVDYLPKEMADEIIAKNNFNRYFLQQPQFTALFFNQNNLGDISDIQVKQALAHAINKQDYVQSSSYSTIIDSPILPIASEYYRTDIKKYEFDKNKAQELLDKAGWALVEVKDQAQTEESAAAPDGENSDEQTKNRQVKPGVWRKKGDKFLEVSITTVDQKETIQLAEFIRKSWEDLHIIVNLIIAPPQTAQTEIIRPRNYQILLYGVVLGSDPDQYPFWHSSQVSTNGLNLSNYNNKKVDELLEDGRITNNIDVRREKYSQFQEIIINDLPAIFLYSQKYPYLQTKNIKGFDTNNITTPSDRFSNITEWYTKTKKTFVWHKN